MIKIAEQVTADGYAIHASQIEQFHREGFLVLNSLICDLAVKELGYEADEWIDTGLRDRSIESALHYADIGPPTKVELDYLHHGRLVVDKTILNLMSSIFGHNNFTYHHMHIDRHDAATPGKPWHHDYEYPAGIDDGIRVKPLMVHALHYIGGIQEGSAALVLLPGSHRLVGHKKDYASFGVDSLKGELVITSLPRGSTVLINSALRHSRRPGRMGSDGPPLWHRYFTDISYCDAQFVWPQVKPYWREILLRQDALQYDSDRYPYLFADSIFS